MPDEPAYDTFDNHQHCIGVKASMFFWTLLIALFSSISRAISGLDLNFMVIVVGLSRLLDGLRQVS